MVVHWSAHFVCRRDVAITGGGAKDSEEANSMMFDRDRADDKTCAPLHRDCAPLPGHHCFCAALVTTSRLRARRGSSRARRDASRRSDRAMDHAEPIMPGRARSSWPKAPVLAARRAYSRTNIRKSSEWRSRYPHAPWSPSHPCGLRSNTRSPSSFLARASPRK